MRMFLRFGILVGLVAASSACGDSDGNGTLIGATCAGSVECGPAGVCVQGKSGLCTLPCDSSGGPGECPLGALCDREQVETDTAGKGEFTLCFPACSDDGDCRNGYKCNGVSGGPGKVCNPK